MDVWSDGRAIRQSKAAPALTATEHQAIVQDIAAYAHPFKTVHAESGLDDLAFLDQMIGDARIVALGEASHGTAEFFQMKHRMLEYLVKKKGFTVFALEGNWRTHWSPTATRIWAKAMPSPRWRR